MNSVLSRDGIRTHRFQVTLVPCNTFFLRYVNVWRSHANRGNVREMRSSSSVTATKNLSHRTCRWMIPTFEYDHDVWSGKYLTPSTGSWECNFNQKEVNSTSAADTRYVDIAAVAVITLIKKTSEMNIKKSKNRKKSEKFSSKRTNIRWTKNKWCKISKNNFKQKSK